MRIFVVNAIYGCGSTGRTYADLRDFLVANGHECTVFYGMRRNRRPGGVYLGSVLDHKRHALLARITGLYGCFSSGPTRRLLELLDSRRPDVVHLGDLHANYVHIPMLLERLAARDIPVTATLHDCYLFTGGCTYYTVNGCDQWRTACRRCTCRKSQPAWFRDQAERLFRYKRDGFLRIPRLGIVGVSPWIASEARRSPVFANARTIVNIDNWVDLDVFRPCGETVKAGLGLAGRKVVLGVAYRWTVRKGLADFLALAERLPADAALLLVGTLPRGTRLPPNVVAVPATDDVARLAAYYSAASVFVQLSKEETFGKVVAEALACGTPAVVYDSTASPRLVAGGCGICVPTIRGLEGIRNAVLEILASGKEPYAARCRARAEESFDRTRNCARYLRLWRDIAG